MKLSLEEVRRLSLGRKSLLRKENSLPGRFEEQQGYSVSGADLGRKKAVDEKVREISGPGSLKSFGSYSG